MPNKRFNLVDECWIPVKEGHLVSLYDLFSSPNMSNICGNPVEKKSLMDLLLAISQAAHTPKDSSNWENTGPRGQADCILKYLQDKKELFWLFHDEKPFLQIPAISSAKKSGYGVLVPAFAITNTTVLTDSQMERPLTDPEKAMALIRNINYSLGGGKVDNQIALTPGCSSKPKAGKGGKSSAAPGPSVGSYGYLHSYFLGPDLINTVWLNTLTEEEIINTGKFKNGLGTAPWEKYPSGEECPVALALKDSYFGSLISMNRFMLLTDDGVHFSEGISYPNHEKGFWPLTTSINSSVPKPTALWSNPQKKPWRQFDALLSFLSAEKKNKFDCLQLQIPVERLQPKEWGFDNITIWSGGISVSLKSGEQSFKVNNDYVESEFSIPNSEIGKEWFNGLKLEMQKIEFLENKLWKSVAQYLKDLSFNEGKKAAEIANKAKFTLMELCEHSFQDLINDCTDLTGDRRRSRRKTFTKYVEDVYNTYCPRGTPKALNAWSKNYPRFGKDFYVSDKPKAPKQ